MSAELSLASGRVGHSDVPDALRALDVFIGRWITQRASEAAPGQAAVPIVCSDVYEWAAGGRFVLHTAYGLIGGVTVGAIEMIGYDEASQAYRSQLFDSLGNVSTHELVPGEDSCVWTGTATRCTATFSAGGTVQTARHERTEDGVRYEPSMLVTLRKVE